MPTLDALIETSMDWARERLARLNREQRIAVEAPVEALVQMMAGAGTGKTGVMDGVRVPMAIQFFVLLGFAEGMRRSQLSPLKA